MSMLYAIMYGGILGWVIADLIDGGYSNLHSKIKAAILKMNQTLL